MEENKMFCKSCRYWYDGGCWNMSHPEECPLGKVGNGKCEICSEETASKDEKICDNCKRAILAMRRLTERVDGGK